ncbi:hypothetical protein NEOLEDRAFT_1199686, partial [Neolentinus lepideus HHB14362 ss-1]
STHLAADVWTFFEERNSRQHCIFCLHQKAVAPNTKVTTFGAKTSTTGMRKHLCERHADPWIQACDKLQISIKAKEALKAVADYRRRQGQAPVSDSMQMRRPFSDAAFLDAIVEFIVANDQSINVIECPQLRGIFLMLREELNDSDIPHRTTVRNRILEIWDEYLEELASEMEVSHAFIHITDRLNITEKIGFVTLDNASNNDTFMEHLE